MHPDSAWRILPGFAVLGVLGFVARTVGRAAQVSPFVAAIAAGAVVTAAVDPPEWARP